MIISSFTDKNLHLNAASHIERFILLHIFLTDFLEDGAAAGRWMASRPWCLCELPQGFGSRSHQGVVYAQGLSSLSFPPSPPSRPAGLGTGRAFPNALLEKWEVSLWLGRWDTSFISMGSSPKGPHEILMKSQHHQQPQSNPSAHTCFVFFQLPLTSLCSVLRPIFTSPSQTVVEKR